MKFCLGLVFVCCVAATAQAFDCDNDYCDNVTCDTEELENCEHRNGIIRVKGGICGCCDHCVVQLGEGDLCFESLVIGFPPEVECGENLFCDEVTLTCIRQDPASI